MLENWATQIMDYISSSVPALVTFLLKVILCIVIYLIGRKLISWLISLLKKMLTKSEMQEGAITFTCSVCRVLLYCVMILIIALELGVEETSVAALVASVGVAIGLAFQGGLSNLAGGFLILVFQPFHVGDYITTQGEEGTVEKIEIMYTTLLTIDTRRVIVPNGTLADNVIVNVTSADKRRLEIKVTISYDDDLKLAKEVLEQLIQEHPQIMKNEEHTVFVSELKDSGVELGLRCWVPTSDYLKILWSLNEQIKEAFDQAGLHIPYPQMEVHVTNQVHVNTADGEDTQQLED